MHDRISEVQSDDYYPFGLAFKSYTRSQSTAQNFKYNGVEQVEELGWTMTRFRPYDASIGRFVSIDPLTPIIPSQSPYHFGFNNPVRYSDPLGLMGESSPGSSPIQQELEEQGAELRSRIASYRNGGNGGEQDGAFSVYEIYKRMKDQLNAKAEGKGTPYILHHGRNEWISAQEIVDTDETHQDAEYRQRAIDALNQTNGGDDRTGLQIANDIAYEINKWNPLAIAINSVHAYFTGVDWERGNPMSASDATLNLASIIPAGRVLKVGKFVVQSNAVSHIFRKAAGHVNPQTATSQLRYLNLFSDVANNPANLVPTPNAAAAQAGVQTFQQTFNNGVVWVQVRSGKIFNAGVNPLN